MLKTPQDVRTLALDLSLATWTLAALGALFEAGLVEHLREPITVDELAARCSTLSRSHIERCLDVALEAGVVVRDDGRHRLAEGMLSFAQQPMRLALAGEIRSTLMQSLHFLDAAGGTNTSSAQWSHVDRKLLQAQGDASAGFPPMFKMNVLPNLEGLGERLESPGARFLDVGVGVASLAIGMCRAWPQLHVVGLDTFEAPLSIARENVRAAGVGDRLELRNLDVSSLTDEETFDLAWLPGVFVPEPVLSRALERVRASLRTGGWLVYPVMAELGGGRQRAVWNLMNDLWGGPILSSGDVETRLTEAGFRAVRTLPGPPFAPALVVGQR